MSDSSFLWVQDAILRFRVGSPPGAAAVDAVVGEHGWSRSRLADGADDENVRTSSEALLTDATPQSRQLMAQIRQSLARGMAAYTERYPAVPAEMDEGLRLLRYAEGEHYGRHMDAGSHITAGRVLSFIQVLSDDFDGGELLFPRQSIELALRGGDALLFPSNFVFEHQVAPIRRGLRLAAVTWLRPVPVSPSLPRWVTGEG